MDYNILDLINLKLFEETIQYLHKVTNTPYSLIDINGRILSCIGWSDYCINLHNKNIFNSNICTESDLTTMQISNNKSYYVYKCPQNLYYAFIPVKLDNIILCYLCLGAFLFEKPDMSFFKSQAKKYKYNENKYLDDIANIKILDKTNFNDIMNLLVTCCKQLEHTAKKQIENLKKETRMLKLNEELEKKITSLICFNEIISKEEYDKLNNTVKEKDEQLKNAIKYDKLKTEFFSNISHELKTPINVIFSALQVITPKTNDPICSNSTNNEKTDKYLHIMRQNCLRLIRLVNNILDISKLESGYLKLNYENYNIVELVENVTLSIVDYIESTGIEIVFDTNKEEQFIACDPESIERIILNLLSNAVKFTNKGGKITVQMTIDSETVSISIKDTGIGIPYNKQKNIFDRFVQANKSISRENEGSGIGLSLVKALVQAHDGEILLNSEVNLGTEFIINLPIKIIKSTAIPKIKNTNNKDSCIEKVHIEFSDIYI